MKRKPAIGGEKKRKLAALGNISDILVTFEKLEVAPFPSSAGATANFISLQASLLISSQTLRLVAAQSISGASRNSVNVQIKACPQGRKKFGDIEGDFDCGASSLADFILNYFLSNSPYPPSLEKLISPWKVIESILPLADLRQAEGVFHSYTLPWIC